MSSMLSRAKMKRWTRKRRRGLMLPAEATALSTRTRREWPTTRGVTRYHRREWYWLMDREIEE